MRLCLPILLLLVPVAALVGCREPKISVYTVPKEKDPEFPSPPPGDAQAAVPKADGTMAGSVPTAAGPGLSWTAPADWREKPAGAMRKASYTIAGPEGTADVSVTAFPRDVGGELANVNRWRGQVQLPPITAESLPGSVSHLDQNGLHITLVDLTGGSGATGILGAIVPQPDSTWFFKISGPTALVASQRAAFRTFLGGVRPAARP